MVSTTSGLANVILAHHQVHFDIPYGLNGLNISGFVLYADATGDDTSRNVVLFLLCP